MPAPEQKDEHSLKPDGELDFLGSQQTREAKSWLPWIIAAAAVVLGLGIWVIVGTRANPDSRPPEPAWLLPTPTQPA